MLKIIYISLFLSQNVINNFRTCLLLWSFAECSVILLYFESSFCGRFFAKMVSSSSSSFMHAPLRCDFAVISIKRWYLFLYSLSLDLTMWSALANEALAHVVQVEPWKYYERDPLFLLLVTLWPLPCEQAQVDLQDGEHHMAGYLLATANSQPTTRHANEAIVHQLTRDCAWHVDQRWSIPADCWSTESNEFVD